MRRRVRGHADWRELISGDRFEMAVGAGDWPASFEAWGQPYPLPEERVARLAETVKALRLLWSGELVDFEGRFHLLRQAACTPVPDVAPRVVVGIGASKSLLEAAIDYADELKVYADERVLARAQELIASSGLEVAVSMFFSWEWDKWPADPVADLSHWRDRGVGRALVSLGGEDMPARLKLLAEIE